MKEENKSFAGEVWKTLNSIDVTKQLQVIKTKRSELSYLSWSYAWGLLMEYYPESKYTFSISQPVEEGGYEVSCTLTVIEGDKSLDRMIWLPVMDFKNDAMLKPTVMDVNKTRMRCLVKAIAMAGLAHYVYTGEDVPMDDTPKKRINKRAMQKSVRAIIDGLDAGDDNVVYESYEELTRDEQLWMWKQLDTKQHNEIKRISMEANKK